MKLCSISCGKCDKNLTTFPVIMLFTIDLLFIIDSPYIV